MPMRRLLVALLPTISAIACTQLASAADLAVKAPAVAPANAPLPVYNWTGFYVGGNAGGAWSKTDWTFFNGGNSEAFSQDASSWIAGGQIATGISLAPIGCWELRPPGPQQICWIHRVLRLMLIVPGNRKLLTSSL
jgi:hypothetical protein